MLIFQLKQFFKSIFILRNITSTHKYNNCILVLS